MFFSGKIFNCFSSYNRNTMSATHHHIFHRIWWSEDLLCHVHSMVYSFNDSVMVNYTTPANKQTWKTFSYFFPQRMKNTRQKYTSSFASPMTYSILYICHSFYKRISVLLLPHTTGTDWNRTKNCDGRPHPCSKIVCLSSMSTIATVTRTSMMTMMTTMKAPHYSVNSIWLFYPLVYNSLVSFMFFYFFFPAFLSSLFLFTQPLHKRYRNPFFPPIPGRWTWKKGGCVVAAEKE